MVAMPCCPYMIYMVLCPNIETLKVNTTTPFMICPVWSSAVVGMYSYAEPIAVAGDFFRDLQEEFQNWEANASSQGKPKSLWEELSEIGEEFVEFLEKELNITNEDIGGEAPREDSFKSSGAQRANNVDNGTGGKNKNSIEESIDDIEAALAQLKKELGI
uniref:Uncharacterized protein n=1 Tax=Chenopodium quinoa TaxID=63459 RepID=A0A803KRU0_CHEQI